METVTRERVIPTSTFDHNLRKHAVQELNHPAYTVKEATPVSSQVVLQPTETKAVAAEHPGTEEFSFNEELKSKHRDLKAIAKGLFIPFLGGNEKRTGVGRMWEKMKALRHRRKMQQPIKVDSSQEPD